MGGNGDFTVEVSRTEVVTPAVPPRDYWLPRSNLDQFFSHMEVATVMIYKKTPSFSFESMVTILKESLAQVLVPYYAFSGEIVLNSSGEFELHCNNRGVDFHEAHADIELQYLDFYGNNESIQEKLLPVNNQSTLCVQATKMKCGGLVVACTSDHRIADAISMNLLLTSWAEIAQSKPISVLPSFRRSLLGPSPSRNVASYLDNKYVPLSALSNPTVGLGAYRFYYIEEKQINHLHELANSGNVGTKKKTKLEAFCAFMAKVVSSRETDNNKICRIAVIVDGRNQLASTDNYVGNVILLASDKEKVGDVKERKMNWMADKVHDSIQRVATKGFFQDTIDWIEARRPVLHHDSVLQRDGDHDDGPLFVLSSVIGLGAPGNVDFGWGKPLLGIYIDLKDHPAAWDFIMLLPSPREGRRDWIVRIRMLEDRLDFVERQARDVLKPLTFGYINGVDGGNNGGGYEKRVNMKLLSAI